MEKSVKKSAEELLELFGKDPVMVVELGKEEYFIRKDVGQDDGKGGKITEDNAWLQVSGYVYDKVSEQKVQVPYINLNGAFDIRRFDKCRAAGDNKFTFNVRFGKPTENAKGYVNLPIYVKGIEKAQHTTDFVGDVRKITDGNKSQKLFLVGKKDQATGDEPKANVVILNSKKEVLLEGVDCSVGKTLAVRGDLVTSWEDKKEKQSIFPRIIRNSAEALKNEIIARKANAVKEEGASYESKPVAKKKPKMKVS